jgi:hypothetical protein
LQQLYDMSRVYQVDAAVIERAAQWLMAQQADDGSWDPDRGLVHDQIWSNLKDPRLPVTAYVVWGLIESGYGDDGQVQRGLDYVREHWTAAEDAYVLALVANALVAADPHGQVTQQVLDRLDEIKQSDGQSMYWTSDAASFMGATGDSASIETTALAAYAFMRAGQHLGSAQAALDFLVEAKDSYGTWGTTQATILSLKALLLSTEFAGVAAGEATVHVLFNGQTLETLEIDAENAGVVHQVVIERGVQPGDNEVTLDVVGASNLVAQVTAAYYVPWSQAPPQTSQTLAVEVEYDRTTLAVDDQVTATVHVVWQQPGGARMLLLDLGLPPGFTVLTQDLQALVESGQVQRYELTGRQLLVYLEDFTSEGPLTFQYRLRARFPMRAKTPLYSAYDYYNPGLRTEQAPDEMVVTE